MPITHGRDAIRAILETDRAWGAYGLADLAPEHASHAEWHVRGAGLALVYRAFETPVLLAAGQRPPLDEVTAEPRVYLSLRLEDAAALQRLGYVIEEERFMLRMALDPHRFTAPDDAGVERLGTEDLEALRRLYAGEPPEFFLPAMLASGVYYGIREAGELVSVAGTHVWAPELEVAGLGNIYTRRDRRNRGYARRVTAAVTRELLGLRTIVLNVNERNAPAIRVYQRLGYAVHCRYREGAALKAV